MDSFRYTCHSVVSGFQLTAAVIVVHLEDMPHGMLCAGLFDVCLVGIFLTSMYVP